MRRSLMIFVLLLATMPAFAQNYEADTLAILDNILTNDFESAAKNFNATMRAGLPPAKLKTVYETQIAPQIGAFQESGKATVSRQDGLIVVTLPVRFEKGPLLFIVTFDGAGKVAGLSFKPAEAPEPAPTDFADYKTKSPLRLPFDGEWFVFWGGRGREQNYHVISVDQRFAYDFVIRRGGSTFSGDPKNNESYYCWGSPVFAPADGVVASLVDGIADNTPGTMNTFVPPGNHLVIDHENGEFSLLAHFRNGTIAPKEGDRVKRGQLIGRCGNSGNSSEPHVHYHLQTEGRFGEGEGLPAQFLEYTADGDGVTRGEPVRGQVVKNK